MIFVWVLYALVETSHTVPGGTNPAPLVHGELEDSPKDPFTGELPSPVDDAVSEHLGSLNPDASPRPPLEEPGFAVPEPATPSLHLPFPHPTKLEQPGFSRVLDH